MKVHKLVCNIQFLKQFIILSNHSQALQTLHSSTYHLTGSTMSWHQVPQFTYSSPHVCLSYIQHRPLGSTVSMSWGRGWFRLSACPSEHHRSSSFSSLENLRTRSNGEFNTNKLVTINVDVKKVYEVCSKSIRIGIVVVVHWVGCVCSQSWHVRSFLSISWHKLQVVAFTQMAVVGRGSNTYVYVIEIFTMCESTGQQICNKFCFKIGKTATETYQLLQQAYGEDSMGRTQVFDWFRRTF